ncbi:MAG: hypothetical protein EOP84_09780 [Verrucomicrobiaceae bacterium]|nr:MAG: hypothetical protein EOP84_09780 [Verrucomicrobiaceae bacterium]
MKAILALTSSVLIWGSASASAQTVLVARLPVVGPTPTAAQARELVLNGPPGYKIKTCRANMDAFGKFAHSDLTPLPHAKPEDRQIGVKLSGSFKVIDQKRRLELRYSEAWPVQFTFDKDGVAFPNVTESSFGGGVILDNEGCAIIDGGADEKPREILFVALLAPDVAFNQAGEKATAPP